MARLPQISFENQNRIVLITEKCIAIQSNKISKLHVNPISKFSFYNAIDSNTFAVTFDMMLYGLTLKGKELQPVKNSNKHNRQDY